jgi:threonine/homoserine/homoserine lactone efflux protein
VDTFLLAVLVGLAISVPPGPLGALCLSQTLRAGLRAGRAVGMAVASGDAVLGSAAALGADTIGSLPPWVGRTSAAVAALALVWIGTRVFRRAGGPPSPARNGSRWRAAGGAFLLALSTPATLPALLVLFAALEIDRPGPAVVGVFVGGCLWWRMLCRLAYVRHDRAQAVLRRIDYACAALLWLGAGAAARFALVS